MARKPMVTRTFTTLSVSVMVCDTVTGTVETRNFDFPRVIDDKQIIKSVKSILDECVVPVKVLSRVENEVLYGMSEEDFMRLATVLPPRTVTEE